MKTKATVDQDIAIYKAYVEAINNKTGVESVANHYKIARQAVYDAIRRVKQGNHKKILENLIIARNEILWEYKYRPMYLSLPLNKKTGTVEEVNAIIKSMYTEGFPETLIAKKLKIARSTVRFHLSK